MIAQSTKVRLYVKARSVKSIKEWLKDNYIDAEIFNAHMFYYSKYFVLERQEAKKLKELFPQRDMRITEHYT